MLSKVTFPVMQFAVYVHRSEYEILGSRRAQKPIPAKTLNYGFEEIQSNDVMAVLKSYGYKTVAFNTMFGFVNISHADVYYDFAYFPNTTIRSLNGFESGLLYELPSGALIEDYLSFERAHYNNVLQVLEKLPAIPQEVSSPKFVYAHIVVPHTPFVFSASGEYLADGHRDYSAKEKYSDQVDFIDGQIVSIARQIIQNSTNPPIIIIQGDHGVPLEYIEAGGTGAKNPAY